MQAVYYADCVCMRAEQKKGVYTYGNFQKEKGLGTLGREYWKEPRR
jgi:hypothetical protein